MKPIAKHAILAALSLALVPALPAHAETTPEFASSPAASARSVVIDAGSATLYMMENGRVVDSMKVIVGKPGEPTPELKTALTYATVNPYWHVPTDIARTLTAPNVLRQGIPYLTSHGYEVVSSFTPDAEIIDPSTVDWQAVADGRETVFVRQRPGPANSMGNMKFSLAAGGQIFLHDTPKKELFSKDDRKLSSGCIRLEDAPRLARWLFGESLQVAASAPEQKIRVPQYVPVTITYDSPQATMQVAALR